jgi:uncharacterized protein YkwD
MSMKKKIASGTAALALSVLIGAGTIAPAHAASLSDPMASRVYELVNQHRINNGLKPLVWNQSIANVAQNWSDSMDPNIEAGGNAGFYHNPSFADQYPAGWNAAAENIAINSNADALFTAWKNSPGHNANMLNPNLTDFGFGYAYLDSGMYATQYVATQNFAGYPTAAPTPVDPTPVETPANNLSLDVSSGAATAGQTVTVSGVTNQAAVDLKLTYNFGSTTGTPTFMIQELTVTPNADGSFSYSFTIPADALEGSVEINANASGNVANALVSVVLANPAPVDPTPVDPAPVDETPVDETPVDPAPVDPAPVDPAPVDPTPVDPAPVDPAPVDPAPVDPAPVDPTPVDETPVDETPVEEVPVDEETPADEETPVDEGPDNQIPGGEDSVPLNDPSDDVLVDADRGTIEIVETRNGDALYIKNLTPGAKYGVWFQSTPLNAGTFTADTDGSVTVDVPASLVAGEHKVAVYTPMGELVGWAPFTVDAAVVPGVEVPVEETPAPTTPVEEAPAAEEVPVAEEAVAGEETSAVLTLDDTVTSSDDVAAVETVADSADEATATAETERSDLAETSSEKAALGFFGGVLVVMLGLGTAISRRFTLAGAKK